MLVCGAGGVGKSTVIHAIGRLLSQRDRAVAIIDTDSLAQFGPPPRADSGLGSGTEFYDNLKCANLAAVWNNFRDAGARYAVVSAGIDSAGSRARYSDALAGCTVSMVRLTAPTQAVRDRLRQRAAQPGEQWHAPLAHHLARLAEEEAALDVAGIEDFTAVNDRSPGDVAREIVDRVGWLTMSD